eukprot:1943505-Prymnesium_polylepis.1
MPSRVRGLALVQRCASQQLCSGPHAWLARTGRLTAAPILIFLAPREPVFPAVPRSHDVRLKPSVH